MTETIVWKRVEESSWSLFEGNQSGGTQGNHQNLSEVSGFPVRE